MITSALREGPSMDMYPRRQTCTWIEQDNGLSARVCEDGQVMLWRDDQRNVWLPTEKPPARWRRFFRHMPTLNLGAASPPPGVCTPHTTPIPLAKVRRLQRALQGLAGRTQDKTLHVLDDGLIGAHTVYATNHAMVTHVGTPAELATGRLSHPQISAFAPQLAAYIEKAPLAQAAPAAASPPPQYDAGAPTMPQYNDDPGYYPPQQAVYYPPARPAYGPPPGAYGPPGYGQPHRAPGGLPGDRASLDIKSFIPAQYEHIRLEPGTAMLIIGVGVAFVWVLMDKKKKAGAAAGG